MTNDAFQELVWQKGRELYRDMPWRTDTRPYYVLVSELMLQQTQVSRVVPKFEAFIAQFPDEQVLAQASLAEVLRLWQGLGYNRRARFLHEAVKQIVAQGSFPSTYEELVRLPGIGPNTAGAILAYSYNYPSIFIETNIRTVYILHFYADNEGVNDTQIKDKLAATISKEHPREWYWAIMDYGSYLKATGIRVHRTSHHYVKQPPLKGSIREVRGKIIKALVQYGDMNDHALRRHIGYDERYKPALEGLVRDSLVIIRDDRVYLTK